MMKSFSKKIWKRIGVASGIIQCYLNTVSKPIWIILPYTLIKIQAFQIFPLSNTDKYDVINDTK